MPETTCDPDWWTEGYSSTWERVKHAVRRDWEQTKGDLADNGVDLNQGAIDTIRQALGAQPIPRDNLPNPGPRYGCESAWESIQAAARFGYGARLHYDDSDWSEELAGRLRRDWHVSRHPQTWEEVKRAVEHGWRSVGTRESPGFSPNPR